MKTRLRQGFDGQVKRHYQSKRVKKYEARWSEGRSGFEERSDDSAEPKGSRKICGLLALGAFAGMRSSAISRLDYSEIDFAQRGIHTPAEKTKNHRRHRSGQRLVQNHRRHAKPRPGNRGCSKRVMGGGGVHGGGKAEEPL